MIGKEWMLVTAGDKQKANTMTASWGGLGVMWGKEVAFIVIRPQRYTKEFIDGGEHLSLCVLDESHRKTLSYLGTVSGRTEDKIQNSGLTLAFDEPAPISRRPTPCSSAKSSMPRNTARSVFWTLIWMGNGIPIRTITPCISVKLKRACSAEKEPKKGECQAKHSPFVTLSRFSHQKNFV